MSKESKEVVTFTCDCGECGKKAQVERVCGKEFPYPYAKGWVYLHTFNWKKKPSAKKNRQALKSDSPTMPAIVSHFKREGFISDHTDKHFCSRKHLLKWLTERIETE